MEEAFYTFTDIYDTKLLIFDAKPNTYIIFKAFGILYNSVLTLSSRPEHWHVLTQDVWCSRGRIYSCSVKFS